MMMVNNSLFCSFQFQFLFLLQIFQYIVSLCHINWKITISNYRESIEIGVPTMQGRVELR